MTTALANKGGAWLLESGDADIAKNLTPDQIAGLAGKDSVKVETYPQAAVHFLSLNQKAAELQPEAVCQAGQAVEDADDVGHFQQPVVLKVQVA